MSDIFYSASVILIEENKLGFLLAFVPLCINIVILIYILGNMPKGRITHIFTLLLISLISIQLEHSLVRLNIPISAARYINQVFSFGWLLMGCFTLHFALVFTENKIIYSRYFYTLLYGPFFLFFSIYHANPNPVPHIPNGMWGYLIEMRPGSLDLIQRYWIAALVYIGIAILLYYSLSGKGSIRKRKQALIIAMGMIIPSIQGVLTQIIFPYFGFDQIPVTSTSITFLSGAIIIALKKYKLFNISESLQLEKVLNELTIPIFCISVDYGVIYNNASFKNRFGNENRNTREDLLNLFANRKDFDLFFEKIFQGRSIKSVKNYECNLINKDKELINVLISSQPIYNNGKLQGVLVFANDITDRILVEEKLKESNKRYKIVTAATAEIIWDLDLGKRLIYWGDGYRNIFGYHIKDNITDLKHWEDRVHPDDYNVVIKSLNEHIQNNKSHKWEKEYRYLTKDGIYAIVQDRGYILRNSKGVAIRMVGAMQDITATKRHIQEIENKNERLSEIAWLQSHVVRAPLARIMSITDLLLEKDCSRDEETIFLKALRESSLELDTVIRKVNEKTEFLNK